MGFKNAKISQADWDLLVFLTAENSWLAKQTAQTAVLALAIGQGIVQAASQQAKELVAA